MWQPNISNPTIPLGSTILVTGANGLIASNLVDQLLAAGYNVRGTVRNTVRCAWLPSAIEERYGPGRFELVEVPDMAKPGAWNGAVQGVSGIAHVIGAVSEITECKVREDLEPEMIAHISLLEAARAEKGIKSFVLTSSAWAVWTPDASKKVKLSQWDWNQEAVDLALSNTPEKGLIHVMAVKTLMEQRIWEWVRAEQPSFTFNAVLLDTVMGHCLQPKNVPPTSTNAMVKWVYDGVNMEFLDSLQPQWFVDSRDSALLFIAALTTPGVNGERLFGFAERYSWPKVAQILQQLYPEKNVKTLADNGWDQTEVPNERAEELLRRVKLAGWTSLEESVREAAACFV
ncbi:NAD(P)-binding protein [Xylaria intraflava]|nr:NAD(P)-binding protein [Xylaria intraflava]